MAVPSLLSSSSSFFSSLTFLFHFSSTFNDISRTRQTAGNSTKYQLETNTHTRYSQLIRFLLLSTIEETIFQDSIYLVFFFLLFIYLLFCEDLFYFFFFSLHLLLVLFLFSSSVFISKWTSLRPSCGRIMNYLLHGYLFFFCFCFSVLFCIFRRFIIFCGSKGTVN